MFPMRSAIRSCVFLVAFATQTQAAFAAGPSQFDLVCDTRGHVAADPHPRFRGTYPANARNWRTHLHYIVDLRTRRFCDPADCVQYGAQRITAANAGEIILYDQPLTASTNALVVTVRNRDGFYRLRQEADDGYVLVETGACRRVRFSGFPAGTRPAASRDR